MMLLCFAGINLFLGLMPYLDNFAHIGGLAMGFTLALWLCVLPRVDGHGESVPKRCYTQLLRVSGCVVTHLVSGVRTAVHDRSHFCKAQVSVTADTLRCPVRLLLRCHTSQLVGFAASIGLMVVVLVVLFDGKPDNVEEWCSGCKSLSCVEIPSGDPWWR
jgi:hypothetical protein